MENTLFIKGKNSKVLMSHHTEQPSSNLSKPENERKFFKSRPKRTTETSIFGKSYHKNESKRIECRLSNKIRTYSKKTINKVSH